ncbi:hypothetical protein ACFWOT_08915 [Streptomyces sp. NPDC058440]|uniref:hypothetical protein n=1 Tax=Streptomyces sp. NPDC058440 TaxID=3346501 RepID=UPI003660400E
MASRGTWRVGVTCVLPALLLTVLAGCGQPSGSTDARERSGAPAFALPSGHGAVFLDVGECSSFGTTSFTEVPCSGERAAARVTARHDGRPADGPPCPPDTDFVLHIGAQPAVPGREGGAIPQGYACMRNLQPPHPGDPGGGGGPRTVVGDCLYGSGRGQVRETACDGSGGKKPEYRVIRAVRSREQCPASTALYVRLGGNEPVGCARRL